MGLVTRHTDANNAPLRDPLATNDAGQVTSRSWMAWFQQLYRGMVTAYSAQAMLTVQSDGRRDLEPEMRALVEASKETARAYDDTGLRQQLASLDPPRIFDDTELRRQAAAIETPRAYDDAELRAQLASIEVRRAGSDVQWLADTHANRLALYPAAASPNGSRFFESDRSVLYVNVAGVWVYCSGLMSAALASKPGDLGANDAGFLFGSTDYRHTHRWTGAAWDFAPGDDGAGYFQDFAIAPAIASAWQVCDGSATTYVKADATTAAFTTPDLSSGVYRKGAAAGGYTGTVNAAGSGTFSGATVSSVTAGTPAGTNTAPALTMDPYTPAGTVSQPTFLGSAGTTGTDSGSNTFPMGSSAADTVAQHTHTHNFTSAGTVTQPSFTGNAATLTGNVAAPVFTGTALAVHTHTLTGGTVTFASDAVQNLACPVYFRR